MKKILYPLLAAALLAACARTEPHEEPEEAPVSLALLISRQSRLYTSEYVVHKIVTHNDLKRLRGSLMGLKFDHTLPVGDRKIAIPIDVTLQAYIDLARLREEDVELGPDSTVCVTLPDPCVAVVASQVDHEGIRSHVGVLRNRFSDAELAELARQGEASVVQTVPRMGILESARQNAAALLIPLIADMGYPEERIVIRFRKDFGEEDLKDLYVGRAKIKE